MTRRAAAPWAAATSGLLAPALLAPALLALALLLPGGPARAQSWPNETGQGGDLMGYSSRQFDRIRAPEPVPPAAALPPPLGLPAAPPQAPSVQGWTPPPLPPQAQAPRQARPPRARRPAQARRHTPRRNDEAAAQRGFERREAEIQRLQQRLMDDRQRHDSQRANMSLRSAPQPASPPITR